MQCVPYFPVLYLVLHSVFTIFVPESWQLGGEYAASMQGNPVKIRSCTCSCNPRHWVCLYKATEHMLGKVKQAGESQKTYQEREAEWSKLHFCRARTKWSLLQFG